MQNEYKSWIMRTGVGAQEYNLHLLQAKNFD